jgi:transcriptional regulator with XRE-family HTH domain
MPLPTCAPEAILGLRQKAGLNQQAFATSLGVSVSAVSLWERGIKSPTGLSRVVLERFERWLAGELAEPWEDDRAEELEIPDLP